MSDMKKWLKLMESVHPVVATPPTGKSYERDATVVLGPRVGGGVGRFIEFTTEGNAMIDVKGVVKEYAEEDFAIPERDIANGNDWFHMSVTDTTPGTQNDKPEFRPGDLVKVADVYGAVIGPGFGVFVGYGTTGEDCIVLFDGKQIVVPVENLASVLEQNAKDNFDEMDNDGNLSPMSFGSDNVVKTIEIVKNQEPEMDHRDEFSKWLGAVEEALRSEGKELAEDVPSMSVNECGCGSWDCPTCFPAQDEMPGMRGALDGLGGATAAHPMHALNHTLGQSMGQSDTMQNTGGMPQSCASCGGPLDDGHTHEPNVVLGGVDTGLEEVTDDMGADEMIQAPMEEEPMGIPSEPNQRSKDGRGVKLGDIVQKTEYRKVGSESPMTHGNDNLEATDEGVVLSEHDFSEEDEIDYDADPMAVRDYYDTMASSPKSSAEIEQRAELVSVINYMQHLGLSKASKNYPEDMLARLPVEKLKQIKQEVTGSMDETKTRTKSAPIDLDFGDDILSTKNANLPATADTDSSDTPFDQRPMDLPTASRASTQNKLRNMNPSDTMRDYMNRINPMAGADEPELPNDELTLRTATDVPAIISNAMRATGTESPEWHTINNLPGFQDRNIRGMGRQVFGMFTSTPIEQIKTIANVNNQGPNTQQEVRSVAAWLKNNAEDLGQVSLDHGRAIPGYKPDVKEFRINGVRFHVVRDPMGEYIYAYPDKDARTPGGNGDRPQIDQQRPRLREFAGLEIIKPTLFEQLKWDHEILEILKESEIDEEMIDESSLSRLVGKNPGSKHLIQWLHRKHKLGNDAEIVPAKMNSKRLLWKSFKSNPDQFIVVICQNGVAGIKPDENFIKQRTAEFAKKGKEYNPGGDSTLPYELVAFTDDGEELDPRLFQAKTEPGDAPAGRDPRVIKARMGLHTGREMQNPDNVFNLIAEQLGAIQSVYLTGEAPEGDPEKEQPMFKGGVEREKINKRADMKKGVEDMPENDAIAAIFRKVRPVLKQLAHQAQSQLTRSAQRYINGGNFEAGQKLMKSGANLQKLMVTLDKTGDIGLSTGYRSTSRELAIAIIKSLESASGSKQGTEEFKQWANSAARGNAMALKPVLDALRDRLVEIPDYM